MAFWCGYCSTVHTGDGRCGFCRKALIELPDAEMAGRGEWYVFCSYGENVSPLEREQILGRDEPPGSFFTGNAFVSRQHVKLTAGKHEVLAEDLGSDNGTFVETEGSQPWERLLPYQRVGLPSGTCLLLARETLCYVWLAWAPARAGQVETRRAANEISLPETGSIDIGHTARVFCREGEHWLAASGPLVSVNGREAISSPLRRGDRVSVGENHYEYQNRRLFPAQPLSPPQIEISDLAVAKRLHLPRLVIPAGKFVGVLGESGAGKSTLVRTLIGWLRPDRGEIRAFVAGSEISDTMLRRHTAYLPQYDIVHDRLTVQNCLYYSALLKAREKSPQYIGQKIARVLHQVGLFSHRTREIAELSGGQRRRVNIAGELLRENASLLVLDEPTSGLDTANDRNIMELLKSLSRQGRTVVCITHNPANLDLLDEVVLLKNGEISRCGTPSEVTGCRRRIGEVVEEAATDADLRLSSPVPAASPKWLVILGRRVDEFWRGIAGTLWILSVVPCFIGLSLIVACPVAHDDEKRFFLCSVAAMWLGMSIACRELEGHRYRIYLHERDAGGSAGSCLAAYAVFYAAVSLVQTAILTSFCLYSLWQGTQDSRDQAYLFRISGQYQNDVEKMTAELEREFAARNRALSRPSLRRLQDGRWLCVDERCERLQYSIFPEGDRLGVYRTETMEHLFDIDAQRREQLNRGQLEELHGDFGQMDLGAATVEKRGESWLICREQCETATYYLVKDGDFLNVYDREVTGRRLIVFLSLAWLMGTAGAILGLNLSLVESRCKIPASVTVPCLTVLQLLFSELVMGWLADNGYAYFRLTAMTLRDVCYCLTFSRYPDMAFRAYKNEHWQVTGDFWCNIAIFSLYALAVPLGLLWVLLKTANKKHAF